MPVRLGPAFTFYPQTVHSIDRELPSIDAVSITANHKKHPQKPASVRFIPSQPFTPVPQPVGPPVDQASTTVDQRRPTRRGTRIQRHRAGPRYNRALFTLGTHSFTLVHNKNLSKKIRKPALCLFCCPPGLPLCSLCSLSNLQKPQQKALAPTLLTFFAALFYVAQVSDLRVRATFQWRVSAVPKRKNFKFIRAKENISNSWQPLNKMSPLKSRSEFSPY